MMKKEDPKAKARYDTNFALVHKKGILARHDLKKGDLLAGYTLHLTNTNAIFFRFAKDPIPITKDSQLTVTITPKKKAK